MNKSRLRAQLKIDEGIIQQIYSDPLGYKTFGIGHLVTRDDPEWNLPVGTTIKSSRIKEVFEQDLNKAIKDCKDLYGEDFDSWPCTVQEILVNMTFNLGKTKLSKFKRFNGAIQDRDWRLASEHGRDSLWYKQVKSRGVRLMDSLERLA